ncbi:uncharacterized protein [Mytilus edulis]|uniref:uncharacterized protein isoform X3 n=1 Tax=Mytilus edulis TaxID=6550 RepID=UPI0039EF76ED
MTRGVFTFLLVVCVTATITEGYGSYRHGGIVGHTGLYKNHLTSYKDLLTGYGNDHAAGHIYHSGHFHKIVVGRLYRRFHQFGIDLIGNGLRYKNYYFARKCEPLKLYNAFSSCFNEYGRIEDCFPGLIKDGLIGHQHHYQRYGRSYGLGVKFVRRGIIYHKTVYHYHVRSLEFIWTMTSCYNSFHHASICVQKLQKQGLIGAPHPLTGYVGRNTGYHGFKIVHGRFSYHGHAYKLSCSTTRFYSVWNKCYNHYHSVGRCFGYLQQKHLFVSYSSTSIVGYHGYDQLGFKIVHGGFSYHGKAYTLKCSESRFYKVWDDCYGHYHKGSLCFDRLFKQGLFGYNVDSDYAHGDIDYLGYYNSHHGFHLVDGGFTYKDVAYKLSCKTDRFYRSWHDCYDSYHSVDVCFGRLYKSHLFVSLGYHGYDQLGFKIVHGGFSYHGKAYTLKCSESRFYKVWDDCYGHYHKGSVCFDRLFKQGLFGYNVDSDYAHGDIDYLGYYNSHHGFHLVDGGFTYKDVAYKLSCKTDRFYRSWHDCYDSYHSVDVCFGRLYKSHLFVSLDHGDVHTVHTNYHGYKYLGFRVNHRRFTYHGKAYRLKCSTRRFYGLWDDCYNHYHSRSLCFNKIYKQHFFGYYHGASSIVNGGNYVDDFGYYKAHHGFSIVNGGFSYNGAAYKLSCSRTRFYKAWRSCYGTYHSVDVCYGRLLNDHLFVALDHGDNYSVHTNYHGYKYLGFKLHHRRFSYHGKAYRLKCSTRRFYGLWDDCYNHYHSRSLCFNKIYKQHFFGYYHGSSSIVHGGDYIDDLGYYKAHHGFSIVNGGFSYNGAAYKLSCSTTRFYKAWRSCYGTYHSVDVCYGRLLNDHLFVALGGGHGYTNYHGYKYLGFRIRHRRFSYLGKAYRLKFGTRRFYRLWDDCYNTFHDRSVCFNNLYKRHIFGYYHGSSSVVHGSDYINDFGYYKAHHGFSIVNGGFSYNGAAYRLSCSRTRFYKAWRSCYGTYHSVDVCYGRLLKDHLFVALGGHHGYHNYHGYKYLGFRIRHRRFSYLGKAYRLRCGRRRFYKLWDDCYNTYHDRSVCFNNLYKRHIFGFGHAHFHGYKYLGFRIRHRRFTYLGKAYRLKCGRRRFYRLWDSCYNHYHDRSVCFGNLFKRHIFDYYGEYAHAHIGASYRGDYGYYTTHHGFSIVGGNFLYKGAGFKLSCSKARFYSAWNSCYRSYHNVDRCFGTLFNAHLFIRAGPDYDYSFLRKNLYLHRKIAAHHVNRINAVANSHVGRINIVAHTHTRNINHVAKTHVNRISSEANSHIKRFLKIANSHLYRLQKHSKIHLHSLEEQHKRHLLERENQHKTHVVNKEILNHKHEHAIAAAHHYAKGGVYAPAGTVIKTVSHGSYGDYK